MGVMVIQRYVLPNRHYQSFEFNSPNHLTMKGMLAPIQKTINMTAYSVTTYGRRPSLPVRCQAACRAIVFTTIINELNQLLLQVASVRPVFVS